MADSQVVELVGRQTRKEEQEGLLLDTKLSNRIHQFSLWEVLKDLICLPQAQRTYFLAFLATSIIPLIAMGADNHYMHRQPIMTSEQIQTHELCETTVLNPWFDATANGSITAAQKDFFYIQFQVLCSYTYKTPPEMAGFFSFNNGTFTYTKPTGFTRAFPAPMRFGVVLYGGSFFTRALWTLWAQVVVAFGLVLAAAASTRSLRDDISVTCDPPAYNYTAKIISQIRAHFSMTVLKGMTRLVLTVLARAVLSVVKEMLVFIFVAVAKLASSAFNLKEALTSTLLKNKYWVFLDPVEMFLFLAEPMAALESGVWGFTALKQSFKLARGNRLKSILLYELLCLLLILSAAANSYGESKLLNTTSTGSTSSVSSQISPAPLSGGKFVAVTLLNWFTTLAKELPTYAAVTVFYIRCKAFVNKQASMA